MEASWTAGRLCPRASGEAVERKRAGRRSGSRWLTRSLTLTALLLDRGLSDWEQLLGPAGGGAPAALPAGAIAAVFEPTGIARQQGARLLYHPFVAAPPESPADLFAAAEEM